MVGEVVGEVVSGRGVEEGGEERKWGGQERRREGLPISPTGASSAEATAFPHSEPGFFPVSEPIRRYRNYTNRDGPPYDGPMTKSTLPNGSR